MKGRVHDLKRRAVIRNYLHEMQSIIFYLDGYNGSDGEPLSRWKNILPRYVININKGPFYPINSLIAITRMGQISKPVPGTDLNSKKI
jgi:hypothetical protein